MSRELVTWHAAGVLIACGVKLQAIAEYAIANSSDTINRERFAQELGEVIKTLNVIHGEYANPDTFTVTVRRINPGQPG
jgi:hypothetical protein